jgi:hypothetical protein
MKEEKPLIEKWKEKIFEETPFRIAIDKIEQDLKELFDEEIKRLPKISPAKDFIKHIRSKILGDLE